MCSADDGHRFASHCLENATAFSFFHNGKIDDEVERMPFFS